LAGITEDASESRVDDAEERGSVEKTQRINLPRQESGDSQTRPQSAKQGHQKSPSITTQTSLKRARTINNVDKALPPIPGRATSERVANGRDSNEKATTSLFDHGDHEGRPSVEGRISSQSARPSIRDLYDAYGYKQKVKIGPRPSIESGGRSDNMDRSNDFRPVSTLPAGLRMPVRKAAPQQVMPARPQSQQTQRAFPSNFSQREKSPAMPVTPIQIPDRKIPIVKNGLLTPAKTPAEASSPKITPEKRRLMKALQIRQKQLAAQKPTNGLDTDEISARPENTKPEVDESILNATLDVPSHEADSDLIHVTVGDPSKEDNRNVEASPISIPETSDGPSTQASSITDEEEAAAQNKQASGTEEDNAPPLGDGLSSQISRLRESHDGEGTESYQTPPGAETLNDPSMSNNRNTITQATELPGHPPGVVDEALLGRIDLQEHSIATHAVNDAPATTSFPPSMIEKELPREDLADHREALSSWAKSPTVAEFESVTREITTSTVDTHEEQPYLARTQSPKSDIIPTQQKDLLAFHANEEERASSQNSPKIPAALLGGSTLSPNSPSTQISHEMKIEPIRLGPSTPHKATDQISPLEIPLPPIDEDEEMTLRSCQPLPRAIDYSQNSAAQMKSPPKLSEAKRQSQDSDVTATRPSTSDAVGEPQTERQIRRRGVVNPPKRLSSPEHSDEQFLSDDSFMEELKSATLQEAKPISVSKSPIKPVFPRSDSEQRLVDTTKATRSVSSPLNPPNKDEEIFSPPRKPTPLSSRSFSANQSLRPDSHQPSAPVPKKIGVSSGISQRIKALEQLSSRPTSPQSVTSPNTSTFMTQRKSSFRSPPGTSDPKSIPNVQSRPSSAYPSPSPSPEAVKSNPFNNLNRAGYARPESVSVTATIVRDARNKTPEIPLNPSEPRTMEFHQSPLVVEHQKMMPPALSPLEPPRPRFARYASARSGSSSSTEQKVESPQNTRRDSFASILSRSSRAGSEAELPRTLSDSSLSGTASRDEGREEKKDSKRSRLMKRMSSISSMSRRSIANALSPSPKEAPIIERQESIAETPSALVDVGDVNVQFPDTLVSSSSNVVQAED